MHTFGSRPCFELALPLEPGCFERFCLSVGVHVAGQAAAGGEAFAALGAYERFGPRVGVHVAGQVAVPGEAFAAFDTFE